MRSSERSNAAYGAGWPERPSPVSDGLSPARLPWRSSSRARSLPFAPRLDPRRHSPRRNWRDGARRRRFRAIRPDGRTGPRAALPVVAGPRRNAGSSEPRRRCIHRTRSRAHRSAPAQSGYSPRWLRHVGAPGAEPPRSRPGPRPANPDTCQCLAPATPGCSHRTRFGPGVGARARGGFASADRPGSTAGPRPGIPA